MLRLLLSRDFGLVWLAGLVSMTGNWMLHIAVPLYVYRETGSTLATGASVAAIVVPSLLLGSVAGVFVDRWDRRTTMIVTNALRAAVLMPLLLVGSGATIWIVYAAAAAEAAISVFFNPAENALLPRLVDRPRLVTANSLNALNNNLARLVGPPIGAFVLATAGLGGVALADAATYVVGALLLMLVRVDGRPDPATAPTPGDDGSAAASAVGRVWTEWRAGLQLVGGHATLRVIFLMLAAASLGEGFMSTLFVPFVTTVLEGGDLWVGWLMTGQAAGGLLGAVVIGRFGSRFSARKLLGLSCVAFGLIDLTLFNARALEPILGPALVIALIAIVVVGVPAVGLVASFATVMQDATPDRYRGRVFGAQGTTQSLLMLAGIAIAGTLGEVVGIVTLLSMDAGLYILAGVAALTLLPRQSTERPVSVEPAVSGG